MSIVKSTRRNPRQGSQARLDREHSLELKRRKMAEDAAKAQEAQKALEDISKRKRMAE